MKQWIIYFLFFCTTYSMHASDNVRLGFERLKNAYPDQIKAFSDDSIVWADGTIMPTGNSDSSKISTPTLIDHITQPLYIRGKPLYPPQNNGSGVQHMPFFLKMYGSSAQAVEKNLETVLWMPTIFGNSAPRLRITRVNNVHEKIKKISDELEQLVSSHPEYIVFLAHPGGGYKWRTIAGSDRLSNHSFGIALDINPSHSNYWQWDLKKENKPITKNEKITYHNTIPWQIIEIFEKHGFIWGGKWYHYDTMHFEYRPELIA